MSTRINGTDVDVKQEGSVILIPAAMSLMDAYTAIGREITSQEEDVRIQAVIDGLVPDAAHALQLALREKYGFVAAKQNAFGGTDNTSQQVAISATEFTQVPWGRFVVPGVEGYLQTGAQPDEFGRYRLSITGIVKRKHEKGVVEAIELAQKYLRERSIYKGKAIELRLKDDNGQWLAIPEPKFLPIDPNLRNELIYSDATTDAIETSVFAPIEHRELMLESGVPLKSGILLYGQYGTGKTLTMAVAAALAVEHGWSYIKVTRADELADVLRVAHDYGNPTVVSCEDIDAVVSGERNVSMNDVLNTLDGIDTKGVPTMVLLTTNHADRINKAMLRAGRLDAAIHVTAPDAKATERLMRLYGRNQIPASEDISEVATLMAGNNAGDIREVVERAKKATIRRTKKSRQPILASDLMVIALAMNEGELELRREQPEDNRSEQVKAAHVLAAALAPLPMTERINGHTVAAIAATTTLTPER